MSGLEKYQEILHAAKWEPRTRGRMSREARVAQFMPFAALNGFYEEIEATQTEILNRREREIVQEAETWPGDLGEEV